MRPTRATLLALTMWFPAACDPQDLDGYDLEQCAEGGESCDDVDCCDGLLYAVTTDYEYGSGGQVSSTTTCACTSPQ